MLPFVSKNPKKVFSQILCIFLLSLFAFSCKKPPAGSIDSALVQKDFKYMDAKLAIDYKSDDDRFKGNIKLRMRKDSLIWASVGAIGIEGIRALVTRDSVFMIDRQNKTYTRTDFRKLSVMLKFDVNFNMLQAIILANMPFEKQSQDQNTQTEKYTIIFQQREFLKIENYINAKNKRLEQLVLNDSAKNNSLKLLYKDFKNYKGVLLPKSSTANILYMKDQKNLQSIVNLSFAKIEITQEKLLFPFKIPDNYVWK